MTEYKCDYCGAPRKYRLAPTEASACPACKAWGWPVRRLLSRHRAFVIMNERRHRAQGKPRVINALQKIRDELKRYKKDD